MPDSDFSEYPFVQALDEAIDALMWFREGGIKQVPIEPEVWRAFAAVPAQQAAHALPCVPEPSRAEPLGGARTDVVEGDTPEFRAAAMTALRVSFATCKGCAFAAESRVEGLGRVYNPKVAVVNGAELTGDDAMALGSRLEGEAGALFERMFAAIGLPRAELYVTPALKCRVSRKPEISVLQSCSEHLRREIRLARPQAVVLLGPVAAKALYPTGVAATGKVGQWNLMEGSIPTITLHHPMRLLLLGETLSIPLKRENWAALQALRDRLRA